MGSSGSRAACAVPPGAPPCRPRTSLLYALSVFYLLMAIVIIIMAFAIPNQTLTPQIAYGVVGLILFLAALFQMLSVARLARPAPTPELPPPESAVPPT